MCVKQKIVSSCIVPLKYNGNLLVCVCVCVSVVRRMWQVTKLYGNHTYNIFLLSSWNANHALVI